MAPVAAALWVTACGGVPEVHSATVEPSEPLTATPLRCQVDADASSARAALEVEVTWQVNGAPVRGGEGNELAGQYFRKGDSVTCEAQGAGEPVRSAPVSIGNTPPMFDDAQLVLLPPPPPVAAAGEPDGAPPSEAWSPERVELRLFGFFDVDGDPEQWKVQWWVDDEEVEAEGALALAPFLAAHPDASKAATLPPIVVAVSVAPWDGVDEGRPIRSELILERSTP
ncbi:MAG: hypothetical protein ACI8PZ_003333 [Myxococcota bacterium]|jgi:hypothetical protein